MLPTYASFRNVPPSSLAFNASPISGSAPNVSRNIRVQYLNRAGRSLLSAPINVSSSGVAVTLNNDLANGEEIFWIAISAEETMLETDAAIIALWQARDPDQTTLRSLPVTINFTTAEHFENNRVVPTALDLPLTGMLAGAIGQAADTNIYYRYDPESYVDGNGNLLSYGAFAKGVGQWIEYPFTHNAYIADVGGLESSDIRINAINSALKIPPKVGAANSTPTRYWLNNGLKADGGSPRVNAKYTLDLDLAGVDYSSFFANRIAFYLRGYVDRSTGVLDNAIASVGVRQIWNPGNGLICLPEDLPRNHAAVIEIVLEFDNVDLAGILPANQVELELDFIEVSNVQAVTSDLAKIIGDLVFSDYCQYLIVPGLKRLSGVASFAAGFLTEDVNDQIVIGVQADTPNQLITITGSLNALANVKSSGSTLGYSELIRASISTEPGISKLIAASSLSLSNQSISITVTHPLSATGNGIIRADYSDNLIAGSEKADFTPIIGYTVLDVDGALYQSQFEAVSAIASQTFIYDLSDLDPIATLPTPVDAEIVLFEPASVISAVNSSGSITGNVIAYFYYAYESPNLFATRINHFATGVVPTLTTSLAAAINSAGNALAAPNNLSDVQSVITSQINLDVYDRAYIDAIIANLSQTDVNVGNNTTTINNSTGAIATNTNDIQTNINAIATNTADILNLYRKEKTITVASYQLQDSDYRTILDFDSATDITFDIDETQINQPSGGVFEFTARKQGTGNININMLSGSTLEGAASVIDGQFNSVDFAYVGSNKWIATAIKQDIPDTSTLVTKYKQVTANYTVTDNDFRYIISFSDTNDLTLTLDETQLNLPSVGIFEFIAKKSGGGNVLISVPAGTTLEGTGTEITDFNEAVYFAYIGNDTWTAIGKLS